MIILAGLFELFERNTFSFFVLRRKGDELVLTSVIIALIGILFGTRGVPPLILKHTRKKDCLIFGHNQECFRTMRLNFETEKGKKIKTKYRQCVKKEKNNNR